MAIYHLSIKIISRGKGKPAVAAAAYRAADKITSEYDGKTSDYTRKGGVVHTEILLPANAPDDYKDRAVLWNAVEKAEKNGNAQLAREIEVSLPVELTLGQSISLARRYVGEQFVDKGMCADLCVHDKGDGNPHAHIMLTMRPIDERGEWAAKSRKEYILDENGERIRLKSGEFKSRKVNAVDWNEPTKAEEWRAAWGNAVNAELDRRNVETRIDHRSYERQGLEQIPTVHLGVAAAQMECKGIRTERGNLNREIIMTNSQIKQLRARINKLRNWLTEETANAAPTLSEVLHAILNNPDHRYRSQKIRDLQSAAKVFNFLQENKIYTAERLAGKVSQMRGDFDGVRDRLRKNERRLDTLGEHIKQGENFKNHRGCKARYDKLYAEYTALKKSTGLFAERKAKKALENANAYHEANRMEITLCEAAERYLKDVLQSRYDPKKLPPIIKWKEERAEKTTERDALYRQYHKLKDETQRVEEIKRTVDRILKSAEPQKEPLCRRSGDLSI